MSEDTIKQEIHATFKSTGGILGQYLNTIGRERLQPISKVIEAGGYLGIDVAFSADAGAVMTIYLMHPNGIQQELRRASMDLAVSMPLQ
jgi:hypothetical protein